MILPQNAIPSLRKSVPPSASPLRGICHSRRIIGDDDTTFPRPTQAGFGLEVPQFFLGWRGHPAPRLRRRPRRGTTRSRTPTRRTRPRWRRISMPRREIMRRETRERLLFVSSSESRTTIQVNCELDLKSTANLTSSQVATSLQVKLGLHFYRHSDFTSSERERPLWGCFWGAWRDTWLEVIMEGRFFGLRGMSEIWYDYAIKTCSGYCPCAA